MNSASPIRKTWAHAFVLSFSAVSFFVLTMGAGIVPFKSGDIWQERMQTITHCYLHMSGDTAVSAVWTYDVYGRVDRLVTISLNEDAPRMQMPWEQLAPISLTGDPRRGLVYVGNADGSVYSGDLNRVSAAPILIGRHPGAFVRQLACSRDGRWLVTLFDDALFTWDLTRKRLHGTWSNGTVQSAAIMPDSKTVICGLDDGSIVEIDLALQSFVRKVAASASPIVLVAVCPQGRWIASHTIDGELQLIDAATQRVMWTRYHDSSPPILTFSADGEELVASPRSKNQGLVIYESATGIPLATLRGHRAAIRGATIHGERLVSWDTEGRLHVSRPRCLRKPASPESDRDQGRDRMIVPQWDKLITHVRSLVLS